MKLHSLFPTQIYQNKIYSPSNSINKDLIDEAYKIKKMDLSGQKWSKKNYPGGYTSYGSLTNLHQISSTFNELKLKIDKEVLKYTKLLDMDMKPSDIELCSLWINIMASNVTHTMHIHPLSIISGTYYLSLPQNSRGLKIEDPRMNFYMNTPPRKTSARLKNKWFTEIKPKVGEVLLFESWIRHEVPPNPSKEDRISISFNYNWV